MTASVIPKGSPEVIEKWRDEFIVEMRKMGYDTGSVVDEYYKRNPHLRDPKIMDHYFRVWVASRQSLIISHPNDMKRVKEYAYIQGFNDALDEFKAAIESQGYKVEIKND